MTINDWLKSSTEILKQSKISTARLDAIILLEDILKKDRSWLLAHDEEKIAEDLLKLLNSQIDRRKNHEPLAYIRGKCEFYGYDFIVSPATLQPRSETETIVSLAKELIEKNQLEKANLLDVGTGSGAIAISIKKEIPSLNVFATEIQPSALKIAKQNAKKLDANIVFFKGNLLEPILNQPIDIILTNLPYVPLSHTINESAMQEPSVAIFGGEDGLDLYRQLFRQTNSLVSKPRFIITESLPFQHKALTKISNIHNYKLLTTEDFIQVFSFQE
jgi:release factor glutamine methyltransferase